MKLREMDKSGRYTGQVAVAGDGVAENMDNTKNLESSKNEQSPRVVQGSDVIHLSNRSYL